MIVNVHVPTATAATVKLPPPFAVIVATPLQFVLELVNEAFPVCVAVTTCAALGTARNDTDVGFKTTPVGGAVGAEQCGYGTRDL